jgi:SNF2 family DNA or RNA helicase
MVNMLCERVCYRDFSSGPPWFSHHALDCVLDMGTGKSVQALVAVALAHSDPSDSNRASKPRSLVVCPSTLVGHWTGEIEKYFPKLSIFRSLCLVGNRSEREALWNSKSDLVNIVITSYAVLRSDIDYLESDKWSYCILDEGHLLKNPKTGKQIGGGVVEPINAVSLTLRVSLQLLLERPGAYGLVTS